MPNYTKCLMYKLICDEDPTFLYIGHTTNWTKRKALHKSECVIYPHRKVYQKIRKLGGWENIKMIWIEDYPCNNNREGEAREQYWMDTLKSNMNTIRAFLTEEQRKEEAKEYHKESYENNKEAVLEYQKEYYEANKEAIISKRQSKYNCECGGRYTYSHKTEHLRSKKHQDWLLTCVEVQGG